MDSIEDVNNMELKNILDEWDLSHMYKHFKEQKITIKVLKLLKTKHIDKIFENQPIGDQVIFEHKLELWKQEILLGHHTKNTKSTTICATKSIKEPIKVIEVSPYPPMPKIIPTIETQETEAIICPPTRVPQILNTSTILNISTPTTTTNVNDSFNSLQEMPTVSTSTKNMKSTHNIPTPHPGFNKSPRLFNVGANAPCRYNLRNILEETSGGQVIVNYYEKHKILREEHRTALINVIARYIETNGCGLTVSESNQLESQIIELFPTEKEEFYRTKKRGRIYNKIANMKRIYKKFTTEPENSSTRSSSSSSPVFVIKTEYAQFLQRHYSVRLLKTGGNSNEEESMDQYDESTINEWRSTPHTTEEYLEFWKKSQHVRLKHIDDIESLQQILEHWPEYRLYNGIEYIELDFKAKYPDATVFAEVYEANLQKLEKCLFDKISPSSAGIKYLQQYRSCSPESRNLIVLWLLHQLFPPSHTTIVDEIGNKRIKRYSIQDSQNAFLCIRGSQSSLDTAVKFYQSTITPPMILIVGELGQEIDQIYVYFEGVQFPVDTVIQAAQLCCELYFLFNLDYPEEAVLFYSFCQTYFMNIEPELKNTKIYTIINEINAS